GRGGGVGGGARVRGWSIAGSVAFGSSGVDGAMPVGGSRAGDDSTGTSLRPLSATYDTMPAAIAAPTTSVMPKRDRGTAGTVSSLAVLDSVVDLGRRLRGDGSANPTPPPT